MYYKKGKPIMLTNQIATFKKVSLHQFIKDFKALNPNALNLTLDEITELYCNIKMPSRATSGSVGYDFYLPYDISLNIGEVITIPTGIRCQMVEGYSLDIYPKSGLGFKNFTTIANTVGIIDADYYDSQNEGHIIVKLINKGFDVSGDVYQREVSIYGSLERRKGQSFVQGIFHECFAATNDNENTEMTVRNGGFDSTNK